MLAEKQFYVGTRRLVVRSQIDRSTSSLVYGPNVPSVQIDSERIVCWSHGLDPLDVLRAQPLLIFKPLQRLLIQMLCASPPRVTGIISPYQRTCLSQSSSIRPNIVSGGMLRSCEPVRVIEVSMERRWNESAGKTGDPRENPLTSGIIRHDSHMRKSGSGPAGDLTGFTLVGGEQAIRSVTAAPALLKNKTNFTCNFYFFHAVCYLRFIPKINRMTEILAAPNIVVLKADEGECGAAPECEGRGKREIPEKTRRPAASSGTIPTCENPGATPLGIEPGSPRWEAMLIAVQFTVLIVVLTVVHMVGVVLIVVDMVLIMVHMMLIVVHVLPIVVYVMTVVVHVVPIGLLNVVQVELIEVHVVLIVLHEVLVVVMIVNFRFKVNGYLGQGQRSKSLASNMSDKMADGQVIQRRNIPRSARVRLLGASKVMSSIPPAASMGTVPAGDYDDTVNAKDRVSAAQSARAERTLTKRSREDDKLQNKRPLSLNTGEHTTPAAKESNLDIGDEAGSEDDREDSIDDDNDDGDSVEDGDDSLDVPTHFTNEFPLTSGVKKVTDVENTGYMFTEDPNKLVDRLEMTLSLYVIGQLQSRDNSVIGLLVIGSCDGYVTSSIYFHQCSIIEFFRHGANSTVDFLGWVTYRSSAIDVFRHDVDSVNDHYERATYGSSNSIANWTIDLCSSSIC
ncbi:hypothetical protein PR048_028134 [Dryococelus australis]|uniref:Uncharacterized protein n=1 Tax=Dryococelus australis TaxID=614101 RepID=A0ABQ9GIG8_9NEOP|nr:hypothetical protein PR048_028134 [Dryococelus australis]